MPHFVVFVTLASCGQRIQLYICAADNEHTKGRRHYGETFFVQIQNLNVNIRDLTTVKTDITFVQSLLFTRCFAPASYVTSNLERCDL